MTLRIRPQNLRMASSNGMLAGGVLLGQRKTAYVGIPLFPGAGDYHTVRALEVPPSDGRELHVVSRVRARSLLANVCNEHYCDALRKFRYFALLHADIVPERFWLDILVEELERHRADMCSAVVPIKDDNGDVSIAIGNSRNPWDRKKRFSLKECQELGPTFTAADAGYPDDPLLLNTGCMVVDLDKPWVKKTNEYGELVVHFTINDRIVLRQGPRLCVEVESEDWFFSRRIWEQGGKCVATTKVKLKHFGSYGWSNE